MSYLYLEWNQAATPAAKLTLLEKHISEVSADIKAAVASQGNSRNTRELLDYRAQLMQERERLESRPDAGTAVNGGKSVGRFVPPR